MKTIFEVPTLDHDKMMLKRFGQKVSAQGVLERRIVWNLFQYLEEKGFKVASVDYDEGNEVDSWVKTADPKAAMEMIFNLDDATVEIVADGGTNHFIILVLGNGVDLISDWTYSEGDADGFKAAMDAFDTEACA